MKQLTTISKVAVLIIFGFLMSAASVKGQGKTNDGPYATVYSDTGGYLCDTLPWQLVFHDEFNGNAIDETKWYRFFPHTEHDPNQPNQPYAYIYTDRDLFARTHTTEINSTGESQVFRDENVVVSNGTVKFILKQDNPTWMGAKRPFSSGMLHSTNTYRFKKGTRFEIRCKLPNGRGLWPCFWAFGGEDGYNCSREIDAFEFRGDDNARMEMSLHKWLPGGRTNNYSDTHYGFIDHALFHTYAVEWDKDAVTWYVDSMIVNRIFRLASRIRYIPMLNIPIGRTTVNDCTYPAGAYKQFDWFPTDGQVNVITGLGTGGPKDVPLTDKYPKQMEVEYIRVYQRLPEEWLPPICALVGNDVVSTGQNSTFNLKEDFGAVTWSVSPNLNIVASSNTSITVSADAAAVDGDAYITVNFAKSSACGTAVSSKKLRVTK